MKETSKQKILWGLLGGVLCLSPSWAGSSNGSSSGSSTEEYDGTPSSVRAASSHSESEGNSEEDTEEMSPVVDIKSIFTLQDPPGNAASLGDWQREEAARIHGILSGLLGANYDAFISVYKSASDVGSGIASHELGAMYLGGVGVGQNLQLALEYYQKAMDQGHAEATYEFVELAEELGQVTSEKKEELYTLASAMGSSRAQRRLLQFYKK